VVRAVRPLAQEKEPRLRGYETEGGERIGAGDRLLLQKAQAVRAGARGDEDYDVVAADGKVIGRIFEATASPIGTPWMWILTSYRDHEDRTPAHGYETKRQAAMQAFARSWEA
jgi:hypothetical protein